MLARDPVWRGAVSSAFDEGIAGSVFMRFVAFRSRLRFRPVSSFRERMGVFSRPAPPSFAHVLRKIDFRPDVCEKRYRMRAILPVERQSIANERN